MNLAQLATLLMNSSIERTRMILDYLDVEYLPNSLFVIQNQEP